MAIIGAFWYWGSPYYTDVGYQPEQPVPYSHKFHVGELGMDCRYCHVGVETSRSELGHLAKIPWAPSLQGGATVPVIGMTPPARGLWLDPAGRAPPRSRGQPAAPA